MYIPIAIDTYIHMYNLLAHIHKLMLIVFKDCMVTSKHIASYVQIATMPFLASYTYVTGF